MNIKLWSTVYNFLFRNKDEHRIINSLIAKLKLELIFKDKIDLVLVFKKACKISVEILIGIHEIKQISNMSDGTAVIFFLLSQFMDNNTLSEYYTFPWYKSRILRHYQLLVFCGWLIIVYNYRTLLNFWTASRESKLF